jgi:hypothetical protein
VTTLAPGDHRRVGASEMENGRELAACYLFIGAPFPRALTPSLLLMRLAASLDNTFITLNVGILQPRPRTRAKQRPASQKDA